VEDRAGVGDGSVVVEDRAGVGDGVSKTEEDTSGTRVCPDEFKSIIPHPAKTKKNMS